MSRLKYRVRYEAVKGGRGVLGSHYGRSRITALIGAIRALIRAGYWPTHLSVVRNEELTQYAQRKWSGK